MPRNGSPDTGGGDRLLRKALEAEAPVIFYINGIGDNILNLPALRALGELFAGRLSLICCGSDSLFMFDELPLKRAIKIRAKYRPTAASSTLTRSRPRRETVTCFSRLCHGIRNH